MQKWLEVARSYIGTHEGVGAKDNPKVVEMYALAGHAEVKHDAVPWCAAFVGACLSKAGFANTKTLWALDYARYGLRLSEPRVGAIATKKRDGGGHVFFVVDYDDRHAWGLGGNQKDMVSIVRFDRSAIYSYTWPREAGLPSNPREGAFRFGVVSAGSEA